MAREGLTEDEAFARLRRASQVSGGHVRGPEALIATFAVARRPAEERSRPPY